LSSAQLHGVNYVTDHFCLSKQYKIFVAIATTPENGSRANFENSVCACKRKRDQMYSGSECYANKCTVIRQPLTNP
jgi:hypothetical protein